MAAKRSATTELNDTNWNEESVPEEAGMFQRASDDVLEKRVLKSAKRRLPSRDGPSKSAFGAFTGFKTATSNPSPFNFLAGSNTANSTSTSQTTNTSTVKTTSNGSSESTENGADKKEDAVKVQTSSSMSTNKKNKVEQEDEKIFKKSSDYFAKLKGLNESVAQWIKTHVDANPFCILTPIFKDYERYLKEIESKHGTEAEQTVLKSEQAQTQLSNNNNKDTSTEKKSDSSPFGGSSVKLSSASTDWKPEKSIFGNISTNTRSIFGKSEPTADSPKSVFGTADQNTDAPKSIFGSLDEKSKSVFSNLSSEKNPFLSKISNTSENKTNEGESKSDTKPASSFASSNVSAATFSFGSTSTTSNVSAGFSFGSAKPFSFDVQAVKPQDSEEKTENDGKEDEDEEPPKPDFKPVTEEGATYSQRCKVFVKKDGNFSDRGIGILFLKPTPYGKTQLIVRADTSLGNLLLNTLLTDSIPLKRMNKNTIMLVCLVKPESQPPPVPVLLRVKTEQDADLLFETLNKHKK